MDCVNSLYELLASFIFGFFWGLCYLVMIGSDKNPPDDDDQLHS